MLKTVEANCVDTITRVKYKNLTMEQFNTDFQLKNVPCIITGLTKKWDVNKFSWKNFYKRYKNGKFKVGEDDNGKT